MSIGIKFSKVFIILCQFENQPSNFLTKIIFQVIKLQKSLFSDNMS